MGATDIQVQGTGMSMADAFRSLQDEARSEYGTDSYNGTISTISEWADKTRAYQASGQSLDDYLDAQLDELRKREAVGICLQPPTGATPGRYIFAGWAAE